MANADLKTRIIAAMTKHKRKRALAAVELGMEQQQLRDAIRNDQDLRAIYVQKSPKVIHLSGTDGQPMTIKLTEEQLAERDAQQFERLIAPIFGEDKELSDAQSLAKAYGRHSEMCENVIGGGVFERAMRLKKVAGEVDAEIKKILESGFVSVDPLTGEGAADNIAMNTRLKALTQYSSDLHKALIASAEMIVRSRVATAKVRAIKDAGRSNKTGKPGFPVKMAQTNVIAQNVQMTTQK